MESQMKTQNQNPGNKGSIAFIALFRLALLVGPEALLVKTLAHSPLICVVACVAMLSLWLSVDIWPFRPASVANASRPVSQPKTTVYAQNMTKAQWWSYLFCRVVIFCALFHSKLTVV